MIKCEFENGSAAGLRHVTVDGIIMRDNQVLLSKRGTYNGKPINESGKWSLIGGYVDRDETIKEAFCREAFEEAGCKLDNIRLLRIKDNPDRPKEDRQNISFVLVADFISMEINETEEVLELKWFDLNSLPALTEIAFDHGDDLYQFRDYLIGKSSTKEASRLPVPLLPLIQ